MKATGVVRRIDDLGRICLPKEIRRTMRIRVGDPLEIYTDKQGGIILKKYSMIGDIEDLAKEYVESVAHVAECTVCVADCEKIIAAAGKNKGKYLGKMLHSQLIKRMEERKNILASVKESKYCRLVEDLMPYRESVAVITSHGDVAGAILLLGEENDSVFGDFHEKMAICGAKFMGKQLETP